MPRRMISTDISTSERLESCSEFAQLLFDRMIAHQDDWGRLVGEPGKVKARLKPLSRRSRATFDEAIRELANAGLICWYKVAGIHAIALKPDSCEEYQTGVHAKAVGKGRKSHFPAPPAAEFRWPEDGPADAIQDNPGQIGRVQENPAEPNLTQPNLTAPPSPTPPKGGGKCPWCENPTDVGDQSFPAPRRLMQAYHDAYRDRHDACPVAGRESSRQSGKEWGALTRILKLAGSIEQATEIIRHGVASEDGFLIDKGHSLAVIAMHYQGIVEALDKGQTHGVRGEARRGPSTRPPELYAPGLRQTPELAQARAEWERGHLRVQDIAARLNVLRIRAARRCQSKEAS